jgi:hypothetical protein
MNSTEYIGLLLSNSDKGILLSIDNGFKIQFRKQFELEYLNKRAYTNLGAGLHSIDSETEDNYLVPTCEFGSGINFFKQDKLRLSFETSVCYSLAPDQIFGLKSYILFNF